MKEVKSNAALIIVSILLAITFLALQFTIQDNSFSTYQQQKKIDTLVELSSNITEEYSKLYEAYNDTYNELNNLKGEYRELLYETVDNKVELDNTVMKCRELANDYIMLANEHNECVAENSESNQLNSRVDTAKNLLSLLALFI